MSAFRQNQDSAKVATRRLLWLFALTVVLTTVAVNLALALVWKLQLSAAFGYPRYFFQVNSAVTLGLIIVGAHFEIGHLRRGGAHIAKRVGGKLLEKSRDGMEQRLINVVHEMSIAAGVKPPAIYVLEREDAINAFAAGWEQRDSIIAVTRGALERLSRDELQGVVAHELSHIVNGDTRLNMRLIGCVFGLEMVFNFGSYLANMTDARGNRMVWALMGFGLMVAGSAGWLAGRLLKAAVSRQREYLADASAVQFTRNPAGIGGALQKIAGHKKESREGASIHHPQAEVLSHMFLAEARPDSWKRWLALHPSLRERITKIHGYPAPPMPSEPTVDSGEDRMGVMSLAGMAALPKIPAVGMADRLALWGPCKPPDMIIRQEEAWVRLVQANQSHTAFAMIIGFFARRNAEKDVEVWSEIVLKPFGFPPEVQTFLLACLRDLHSLPLHASIPLFERWSWSCSALDSEHKRLLQLGAKRMASGAGDPLGLWFFMVMDRLIEKAELKPIENDRRKKLIDVCSAIAFLTRKLSGFLTFEEGEQQIDAKREAWCMSVYKDLQIKPNFEIVNDDPDALLSAVAEARRAGWLERPKLVRAWYRHSRDHDGRGFDMGETILVIRVLSVLLETPIPPDMTSAFLDPSMGIAIKTRLE